MKVRVSTGVPTSSKNPDPMPKRPAGLIAVIILCFFIGLVVLAIAFLGALSKSLTQLYVFIFSIFAMLYLAIGWGLFKRQNWARILAIVFFGLAILEILFFAFTLKKTSPLEITATAFKIILSSLIIGYLCRPKVQSIFRNPHMERGQISPWLLIAL